MAQVVDIRCCYHDDWSQLSFTSRIRRQVKKLCPKPDHDSHSCVVTVSLVEVGKTGAEQSADIVYGSDDCCADIYLRILSALCLFDRRSSRNHFLPLLLSLVPSHLEDIYDKFVDREIFHIALVRQVAKVVALETGKKHDHTKDAFYTFVTCGKFGGVGADDRPGFESVFDKEVNDHFRQEPHHPQYEGFRQIECRDCDIQEMAIDRLARNRVAANGPDDWETMNDYLPRFKLGDVDRKLARYEEFVQELKSTVVEEHRKLQTTYSQSQGQAPPEVVPDHPGPCSDDCLRAKIHKLAHNKFHIELQSLR